MAPPNGNRIRVKRGKGRKRKTTTLSLLETQSLKKEPLSLSLSLSASIRQNKHFTLDPVHSGGGDAGGAGALTHTPKREEEILKIESTKEREREQAKVIINGPTGK